MLSEMTQIARNIKHSAGHAGRAARKEDQIRLALLHSIEAVFDKTVIFEDCEYDEDDHQIQMAEDGKACFDIVSALDGVHRMAEALREIRAELLECADELDALVENPDYKEFKEAKAKEKAEFWKKLKDIPYPVDKGGMEL